MLQARKLIIFRALVHVPEIDVLAIREVFEGMYHAVILRLLNTLCSNFVPLVVLALEMPSKGQDNKDKKRIAAKMYGEGDEVSGSIPC